MAVRLILDFEDEHLANLKLIRTRLARSGASCSSGVITEETSLADIVRLSLNGLDEAAEALEEGDSSRTVKDLYPAWWES